MFKNFLQSHFSQLSIVRTSSFFKVYDSAPYRTVLHMTVFIILFFKQRLKAFASSSSLLVNTCDRHAQFLFLLVLHYNSLVTSLVNMRAGVTIACDTIEQVTFFLHRRACNYVPHITYFLSNYFY